MYVVDEYVTLHCSLMYMYHSSLQNFFPNLWPTGGGGSPLGWQPETMPLALRNGKGIVEHGALGGGSVIMHCFIDLGGGGKWTPLIVTETYKIIQCFCYDINEKQ